MSKTLDKIAARDWVAYVDDERQYDHGIIITLKNGWEFSDDIGCGVAGFDTVAEAEKRTRQDCVQRMPTV